MTGLSGIVGTPECRALGLAVIHFLWQGAIIAALSAVCLRAMRSRSSQARYLLASGAMLTALVAFLVTFASLIAPDRQSGSIASMGQPELSVPTAGAFAGTFDFAGAAAGCWIIGVLLMAGRHSLQQMAVRRLRRHLVCDPDGHWIREFELLKKELRISDSVKLLSSGLATTVMVIGWLRPVVLVPASGFTGLSAEQLRAVLAHELAHIRRLDHWINLIQGFVEIVLFFHPTVWWLSRQMRIEREYCCDSIAVRATGSSRDLAEALFRLESFRVASASAGLAADGGHLADRVSRIIGTGSRGINSPKRKERTVKQTMGLLVVATLLLTGICVAYAQEQETNPKEKPNASISLEDYLRAEEAIHRAVKRGVITAADAKKRASELYKRLSAEDSRLVVMPRYDLLQKELKESVTRREETLQQRQQTITDLKVQLNALRDRMLALQGELGKAKASSQMQVALNEELTRELNRRSEQLTKKNEIIVKQQQAVEVARQNEIKARDQKALFEDRLNRVMLEKKRTEQEESRSLPGKE